LANGRTTELQGPGASRLTTFQTEFEWFWLHVRRVAAGLSYRRGKAAKDYDVEQQAE
jgi:hypothetical protein